MKIAVAIKQVPLRDSPLRINSAGTWIEEDNLSFEINEPDAYALEEALQLREKHGGEVIVISAGPARVAQSLREGLANPPKRVRVCTFGAIRTTTKAKKEELANQGGAEICESALKRQRRGATRGA